MVEAHIALQCNRIQQGCKEPVTPAHRSQSRTNSMNKKPGAHRQVWQYLLSLLCRLCLSSGQSDLRECEFGTQPHMLWIHIIPMQLSVTMI